METLGKLSAVTALLFCVYMFTTYNHSNFKYKPGEIKCFMGKEVSISKAKNSSDGNSYIIKYWDGKKLCEVSLLESQLEDCK